MKAVYEATYAIPELGVEVGDRIVVRPSHPTAPLSVVRRFGHHALVRFMGEGHLDALRVLHTEPSVIRRPSQSDRPSPRHPQGRARQGHLRVVT